MSIKVKVPSSNTIKVRSGDQAAIKVVASNLADIASLTSLSGLSDVDLSGVSDNFVLQYDSTSQKWKGVDPDQILADSVPGGIPGSFINVLDTDPNRADNIDFDGGTF